MDVSKFAKFSFKTNSVPQSFSVSSDTEDLINMKVEGYRFEKELNVSLFVDSVLDLTSQQNFNFIFHCVTSISYNWKHS